MDETDSKTVSKGSSSSEILSTYPNSAYIGTVDQNGEVADCGVGVAWNTQCEPPMPFTYISGRLMLGSYNLADFITDTGTANGWYYKIYASGRCELYQSSIHRDVSITSSWGSLYESTKLTAPSYPFTVKNARVVCGLTSYGAAVLSSPEFDGDHTTTKPADFYVLRPTPASGVSIYANWVVYAEVDE